LFIALNAVEDFGVRRVLAPLVRADLSVQFDEFFDCGDKSPHTKAVTSSRTPNLQIIVALLNRQKQRGVDFGPL